MTGVGNGLLFITLNPAGPTQSLMQRIPPPTCPSYSRRSVMLTTDLHLVETLRIHWSECCNRTVSSLAFHSAGLRFKSLTRDRPSRLRSSRYFPQAHAGTIPEIMAQSFPSACNLVHFSLIVLCCIL